MSKDDNTLEVPQPPNSKQKWVWIAGGALAILAVLVLLIYIFANKNPPPTSTNSPNTNTTLVTPQEQHTSKIVVTFVIIFAVIAIILVIYAWKTEKISFNIGSLAKPVYSDTGLELAKQNIAKANRMNAAIINDKIVFANPRDFVVGERRVFVKGGNRFLIFEYEMRSGLNPGVWAVIVPLSLGEEIIKYGDFSNLRTSLNMFQMNSRTFPLVGARDRVQQYISTVLEEGDDLDDSKLRLIERITGIGTHQQPVGGVVPYLQSPIQEQIGDFDYSEIPQQFFQKKKPKKRVGPSYPKPLL